MAEIPEQIRERARAWLEPIPGPSPTGVSARLEPAYQALADEVARTDSPMGGEVDWKRVVASSTELLRGTTKDLQLTAYLAHGLHRTGGLEGLAVGLTVVAELMDGQWEACFPELKRLRARANAIQWLMEKTKIALDAAPDSGKDLAGAQALEPAAQRFAEVMRGRLADGSPAMGPLLEAAARLRRAAEAASAPAAAAPPVPAEPAAAPALPQPTAAAPAASPLPAPPSAALAGAADATDFLRTLGASLIGAGAVLRRADLSDPAGYRILRTGLWLHLAGPPPAAGGKTAVPPPAEGLREQLELLAQNQKWAALLEETESALPQNRFWLDLHRLSAQALAGLGPSHEKARAAIVAELRSLLARMPQLPGLAFASGVALADPATRGWLEEELTPGPASGGGASGGSTDEAPTERLAVARKLLAGGQVAEGLAALQAAVEGQPAGRARFRARLALAKACAGASLLPLAKATYEELDQEAVAHGLDGWEPSLASECLKGLIAATRALSKDPRATSDALLTQRYQRLCRLDPAAAHEVWP